MPSRISQLAALTGANTASGDLLPIVDVSDTTMAASGTDKKITLTELQSAPVSAGTANGVLYLNGSKVATSGSALMFDGTNLGVGTSSPGYKLDISGGSARISNDNGLRIAGTTSVDFTTNASGANIDAFTAGSSLIFKTQSTERMRLDASGNLGLGVTPSAWSGLFTPAFETRGGSLVPYSTTEIHLVQNGYFNGTNFVYKVSSQASNYLQVNGQHRWLTAPSGTAGNTLNFTQAMTLDASGRFLVGKTSSSAPVSRVQIAYVGGGTEYGLSLQPVADTTNAITFLNASGTTVGSVSQTTSATSYNTSSDYRLKDNQAPLTGSGSFIDALKPKTWTWKADGTKGVGFIAHEVQEVSPTSVVGEKDATRTEQYEVSPAVPATYDEEGNELTPAVEAVMGEREVPAYQAMEYGSAEFIANIVAELQSLRKRVAALEAGGI